MRTDENNQLIGAGEDTAYSILGFIFKLPGRKNSEFPEQGIYRQFPVMRLLKKKIIDEIGFSEEFKKHSVDIVVSTGKQIIAIYVNGKDHNGILKSFRDSVKYDYLEMSGVKKVILRKSECKEMFKDLHNYKSILQICNGLETSGVNP